MEKIIFFGLVIPIFGFVLYLGINAIIKGTEAKNALKEQGNLKNNENEKTILHRRKGRQEKTNNENRKKV